MDVAYSQLLTELPSFISTISMVEDDRENIIASFRHAERRSPSTYAPARDLIRRILQGDFSYKAAVHHAQAISGDVERRCALSVLETAKEFLCAEAPAAISSVDAMRYQVRSGLELKVGSLWVRHLVPQRLFVLHAWKKPLSEWQRGAFARILRDSLLEYQPDYANLEIDLISVAASEHSSNRKFEKYNWSALKPLDNQSLQRFLNQLLSAWDEYHKRGPRKFYPRRTGELFR